MIWKQKGLRGCEIDMIVSDNYNRHAVINTSF